MGSIPAHRTPVLDAIDKADAAELLASIARLPLGRLRDALQLAIDGTLLPLPPAADDGGHAERAALRLALAAASPGGLAIYVPESELRAAGCSSLAALLRLRALQVRCVAIDANSNALTELGTNFAPLESLCQALHSTTALAALSLRGNMLLRQGCEAVAELLRRAPALRVLGLARSNVGPSGAEALLAAFDASDEDDAADEDGAEGGSGASRPGPLPSPPCRNVWLRWLDLSDANLCGMGGDESRPAMALLRALTESHPTLRHLDLSRNRLSRAALSALTVGLEANTALHTLRLDGNGIDAGPAARLLAAAAVHPRLRVLSLRDNRLRSDGAEAAAALLASQGAALLEWGARGRILPGAVEAAAAAAGAALPPASPGPPFPPPSPPPPRVLRSGDLEEDLAGAFAAAAPGDGDELLPRDTDGRPLPLLMWLDMRDNYVGSGGARAVLRSLGAPLLVPVAAATAPAATATELGDEEGDTDEDDAAVPSAPVSFARWDPAPPAPPLRDRTGVLVPRPPPPRPASAMGPTAAASSSEAVVGSVSPGGCSSSGGTTAGGRQRIASAASHRPSTASSQPAAVTPPRGVSMLRPGGEWAAAAAASAPGGVTSGAAAAAPGGVASGAAAAAPGGVTSGAPGGVTSGAAPGGVASGVRGGAASSSSSLPPPEPPAVVGAAGGGGGGEAPSPATAAGSGVKALRAMRAAAAAAGTAASPLPGGVSAAGQVMSPSSAATDLAGAPPPGEPGEASSCAPAAAPVPEAAADLDPTGTVTATLWVPPPPAAQPVAGDAPRSPAAAPLFFLRRVLLDASAVAAALDVAADRGGAAPAEPPSSAPVAALVGVAPAPVFY